MIVRNILITASITIISIIGQTYGQQSYDCIAVNTNIQDKNIFFDDPSGLLPPEAIQKAYENLQAYCCAANLITDKQICTYPKDKVFPESPYLYDHLIDVIIRRLDGFEDMAYGLEIDTQGIQRRETSKEIATNPAGKTAIQAIDNIENFWWLSDKPIPVPTPYNTNNCGTIDTNLITKNMYTKYINTCFVARCAYDQEIENIKNISTRADTSNGYKTCQDIIQTKVLQELRLARITMSEVANQKLRKAMTDYLKNYFVNSRLQNMQDKLSGVYDAFAVVNRFVIEGTKQCSG